MDSYGTFYSILVSLFHDVNGIEERALITDSFKDITGNDMHVIEAVGTGKPNNMSSIAKRLHVTTGTLSTVMNSLVKKGYVKKERSAKDRRVVYIMLTAKGKLAYNHHEKFHRKMTEALVEELDEDEEKLLEKAMRHLKEFFNDYGKSGGGSDDSGADALSDIERADGISI